MVLMVLILEIMTENQPIFSPRSMLHRLYYIVYILTWQILDNTKIAYKFE